MKLETLFLNSNKLGSERNLASTITPPLKSIPKLRFFLKIKILIESSIKKKNESNFSIFVKIKVKVH